LRLYAEIGWFDAGISWELELYVSTSRIQLISKGRQVPFYSAPELSSANHPWAGYLFEVGKRERDALPRASFLKTTLFLCTGEPGTVYWRHVGIWHEHRVWPGSIFIVRRDTEIQAGWSSDSWPTMLLQLDNAKLQHIAPDQVSEIEKSLASALTTDDHRLAALMLAMRDEVRDGCASGRLYGESLSLAFLAYLAGRYATPGTADDQDARLSPVQKRCVADYVRENLAGNICVMELAAQVQMSPSHFARVFKSSVGVTPYRFVMQERIEGAKDMLASTNLSASQVAMAFGFSSQSHFVKVFRQFTGVTPKQYRTGF
jgi:AraC family transcriptional regulator